MRSVKFLVAAGAASLLSSVAFAADMPITPPPMPMRRRRSQDFGGWYLRGDIGFSNQQCQAAFAIPIRAPTPICSSFQNMTGFDTAGIYRHRRRLSVQQLVPRRRHRRISRQFAISTGIDCQLHLERPGRLSAPTSISATKSEWLFLANAYVDLGTWWCMTPFVGAGVGTARVSIANFTDTGVATLTGGRRRHRASAIGADRLAVEFCLGAACGSRLQGHPELHGRTRLSLCRSGQRHDRRSPDLRRHQRRHDPSSSTTSPRRT